MREQVGLDRNNNTTRGGLARASGRGAQRMRASQTSREQTRKETKIAEQQEQERVQQRSADIEAVFRRPRTIRSINDLQTLQQIEQTAKKREADARTRAQAAYDAVIERARREREAGGRPRNTVSQAKDARKRVFSEVRRLEQIQRDARDAARDVRTAQARNVDVGQVRREDSRAAARERATQARRAREAQQPSVTRQEFAQLQRDGFLLSGRAKDASPEQIRAAEQRAIRSGSAVFVDPVTGRDMGQVGNVVFGVRTPQEAAKGRRQDIQRLADSGQANISLVGGGVGLAHAPSQLVSSPVPNPSRQTTGFLDAAPGTDTGRFDFVGMSERARLSRARASQDVQRAGGFSPAPFARQVGLSAALPFIDTAALGQSFVRNPRQTASLVGQGLVEGAVVGGQVLRGRRQLTGVTRVLTQEPGRAIGAVGGELAFFKGSGVAISGVRRGVEVGSTVLDPRFVMRRSEPGSLGRFDVPARTAPGVTTVPVRIAGPIGSPSLPKMTLQEQVMLGGRTVTPVSGARDLFGTITRREITVNKPLPTPDAPPLERAFFADPAGRIRPSRLGIVDQPAAGLRDLISGDVTFRRTRPQAIVFPQQSIEPLPAPLRDVRQQLAGNRRLAPQQETRFNQWLLSPGTRFRPVGFISPEPEVILPPGAVIVRDRVAGVGLIEGRRVPFIEATVRQADTLPTGANILGGDLLAARSRGLRVASRPVDTRPRLSLSPLLPRALPRRAVVSRPPRAPSPRIVPPRALTPRASTPRPPRAPSPRIVPPRALTPRVPSPRIVTPRAPGPRSPGPRAPGPRSPGPRTPRQLMPRLPRPRARDSGISFGERRRTSDVTTGFEDYTPSFVAVDQKIFGSAPSVRGGFTGLEFRPVVARRSR